MYLILGFNMFPFIIEIVEKIRQVEEPPFRPTMSPDTCTPGIKELMVECLQENPPDRPDVNIIKHKLKKLTK